MLRIHKVLLVIFFIELISQIHSYNQSKVDYNYSEEFITIPIDHFNYSANSQTFSLRYLRNSIYVKNIEDSPIFFYCGGETEIEEFARFTGFMWETAEQFKAEIIFAEHRYYGKSLPFGNTSFDTNNIGYLRTEQALADFVYLLDHLTNHHYNRPVIAFGGSYGGILAAWLRIKYPHIVTGALTSSAPMLNVDNMISCDSYYELIASIFENAYTKSCTSNIKRFFELLKSSSIDIEFLDKTFNFCDKSLSLKSFSFQLENVYWDFAMCNYPHEFKIIEHLPGNPVREFCKYLDKEYENNELIIEMQKGINLYKNYTGDKKCLDLTSTLLSKHHYVIHPWLFQRYTQLIIPMCITKNNKMFLERDLLYYENNIKLWQRYYNITPEDYDIIIRYNSSTLDSASNIIFSNGLLDPWSSAGILESTNEKISIIIIPDGAHHSDLKRAHPKDPPSVIEARKKEISIISRWIKDFYSIYPVIHANSASC